MLDRNTILGLIFSAATLAFVFYFGTEKKENQAPKSAQTQVKAANYVANYGTPKINGKHDDDIWVQAEWLPLKEIWLGNAPSAADFSGRYKVAYDENNLYVLAEIQDDTLIDIQSDGLLKYWDDDCLEIFVDEDASGGNHQYSFNAFAYHIALDGKVVDIAPDSSFQYFNEHCLTRRTTTGKTSVWEVAVKLYDGKKYEIGGDNIPKMLKTGKKMGFALAYCDNDRSKERENFIGNLPVEGADKNRGWIDAGIFGVLELR